MLNLLLYPFYFLALVLQLASEVRVPRFNLLPDGVILLNLLFEPLKPRRVVKLLEPLPRKVDLLIHGLADDPLQLRGSFSAELLELGDGVGVKTLDAFDERTSFLLEALLEAGLRLLLQARHERFLVRRELGFQLLNHRKRRRVRVFAHFGRELAEFFRPNLRVRIAGELFFEPLYCLGFLTLDFLLDFRGHVLLNLRHDAQILRAAARERV